MILSTLSNRTIGRYARAPRGLSGFSCTSTATVASRPTSCAGPGTLLGRRERDLLNGFHVPSDIPVPNLGVDIRDTRASQ